MKKKPPDWNDIGRECEKTGKGLEDMVADTGELMSDTGFAKRARERDLRNATALTNGAGDIKARSDTGAFMLSGTQFDAIYVPPRYLLGGILQKGYLYAMTAPTATGKTALGVLITAHVVTGKPMGGRDVKKGGVLYLAADNETDVQPRWIATREQMGIGPGEADNAHFIPAPVHLSDMIKHIIHVVTRVGGIDLVIVDTGPAIFEGESENDNVDAQEHAERLRWLTRLPGGPCVIVMCHPTKNATKDNLSPRGGGAFVAAIDGNIVLIKTGNRVEVTTQVKFRGPEFTPFYFKLVGVESDRFINEDGVQVPSVIANLISDEEREGFEQAARRDEDEVLMLLATNSGLSHADIAKKLGWETKDGAPNRSRSQRAVGKLQEHNLVTNELLGWELTGRGKTESQKAAKSK